MGQVEISVVIPTYKRPGMLRQAVQSILKQDTGGAFTFEIIVVTFGYEEETNLIVKELSMLSSIGIRIVQHSKKGLGDARNIGVAAANGRWIAFFDDDQLANRDWLKILYETSLEKKAKFVGGTRLLKITSSGLSRIGPVVRINLGEQIYVGKPFRVNGKVFPATGTFLISKGLFDSIGYFDTETFESGEDTELVFRVRSAGIDIWIAPTAIVHHITPEFRLKADYIKWTLQRYGCSFAYRDFKVYGQWGLIGRCIARIGQALIVTSPLLLSAYAKKDKSEVMDIKCLLWRCMGYTRKSIYLLFPRIFPQNKFFSYVVAQMGRKWEDL